MSLAAASPPDRAPIRVLLADDQALVRSGFKGLLDADDDITVVGEAANGTEAVQRARATRPDVVLMDIRMPELDGIQATSQIAKTRGLEQVRVLILTTYDTDEYVFEALQAGASGFLLKDAGPAEQPAVALPDAEALRQQFVEADQDGDGRISRDEWLRAFGPAHADAATDGQPGGPDQPTALPVSTPPPTGTAPVVVQP